MEMKCFSYVIPVYFFSRVFMFAGWWDSRSTGAVICWLGPISRGRRRGKSEKKNMLGGCTRCPEGKDVHPGRLTWNIIMEVWFRSFSFLNG